MKKRAGRTVRSRQAPRRKGSWAVRVVRAQRCLSADALGLGRFHTVRAGSRAASPPLRGCTLYPARPG